MQLYLKHPAIRLASVIFVIIFLGTLILSAFSRHTNNSDISQKNQYVHDSATSDTPVETLKTLTAEVTTVQQQNQKLVEQNKILIEQDQKALSQLKSDVLADVKQQLENFKSEQAAQNATKAAVNKGSQNKDDYLVDSTSTSSGEDNNFIWVSDLQETSTMIKNFNAKNNTNSTNGT